jgi:endoglucanase
MRALPTVWFLFGCTGSGAYLGALDTGTSDLPPGNTGTVPTTESSPPDPNLPTQFSASNYRDVLGKATHFYGAQRCGDTGNWMLSGNPYGDHCHLEDGPGLRANLDLTGGWHDAGDYIKFSLTTAWSAYSLLKARDAFPAAFSDGALLEEVRIATDYLLKIHPDSDTLIAMVGGDEDHTVWVTSPYQSTLGYSQGGGRRMVTDGASADVAGLTAAALALMSLQTEDTAHAAAALATAESVYALGKRRPWTTDTPFYEDGGWEDNMLCGAIELFRATGDPTYLDDARTYDAQVDNHGWIVSWSQSADYGRHSMATLGETSAQQHLKEAVDSYLDAVSTHTHTEGMAFFTDWGTLRYALGAAFSAGLYHDLTGETQARDFAISQVDYAMGKNSYGRSFVVGWGTDAPTHPHHANSYGSNTLDWDLSGAHAFSLDGALVGGPTQSATGPSSPGYADETADWVGNEVTIDYNTGLVGASAFVSSLHP